MPRTISGFIFSETKYLGIMIVTPTLVVLLDDQNLGYMNPLHCKLWLFRETSCKYSEVGYDTMDSDKHALLDSIFQILGDHTGCGLRAYIGCDDN